MFKRIWNWIIKYFQNENIYKYKYIEDVPDFPKSRTIYIIGNQGYYWQLVVECPCGCKKLLYMNLMKEHYPNWSYQISERNKISISPSIDRFVGCKSHFFIKNGHLIWA